MLPYSLEVLFSVMGRFNASVWLFHLGLYIGLPLSLLWTWQGGKPRLSGLLLGTLLAFAWVVSGIGFFWLRFANFDFIAPYEAGLFVFQAALVMGAGVGGRIRMYRPSGPLLGWGLGLVAYGLVLLPLMDYVLSGQAISDVRFGVAPAAVLVATLGVLSIMRAPWYLWLLPLLWSAKAALTGWWLGLHQDLLLPVLSLASLGLVIRGRLRT